MAFFTRHGSLLMLLMVGTGLVIGPGSLARAQDRLEAPSSQHYTFDFRGVTLKDALEHLVDSTRISLVYDMPMVVGKRVACRVEDATAEALLRCIVRGTGLDADRLSSGTFVLRKAQRQPLRPVSPRKHTISGFVYDAASGASLSRAHVYEAAHRLGTTTDTSGYYRLGVWIDSVRLAVSHLGYEKARLALNLRGDTVRHVGLSPAMLWLDSLMVLGERDEDEDQEHRLQGRALYGHVRGFYTGFLFPRVGVGLPLVVGYRFRGKYDIGFSISGLSDSYTRIGPVLGFATRPSKHGWGVRSRLTYRITIRRHYPNEGKGWEVFFREKDFEVEAALYKRFKIGKTTHIFPSIGPFAATATFSRDDKDLHARGLQLALPFMFKGSDGSRLVIEPLFRFFPSAPFKFHNYPYPTFGLELRLNF